MLFNLIIKPTFLMIIIYEININSIYCLKNKINWIKLNLQSFRLNIMKISNLFIKLIIYLKNFSLMNLKKL